MESGHVKAVVSSFCFVWTCSVVLVIELVCWLLMLLEEVLVPLYDISAEAFSPTSRVDLPPVPNISAFASAPHFILISVPIFTPAVAEYVDCEVTFLVR
jgi:hypothetical protein